MSAATIFETGGYKVEQVEQIIGEDEYERFALSVIERLIHLYDIADPSYLTNDRRCRLWLHKALPAAAREQGATFPEMKRAAVRTVDGAYAKAFVETAFDVLKLGGYLEPLGRLAASPRGGRPREAFRLSAKGYRLLDATPSPRQVIWSRPVVALDPEEVADWKEAERWLLENTDWDFDPEVDTREHRRRLDERLTPEQRRELRDGHYWANRDDLMRQEGARRDPADAQ